MNRRRHARLLALAGLALLLFNPPLILLFDRPSGNGLSWLPLYVFVVWGMVIGMAAWLLERSGARSSKRPGEEPWDEPRRKEPQRHEK